MNEWLLKPREEAKVEVTLYSGQAQPGRPGQVARRGQGRETPRLQVCGPSFQVHCRRSHKAATPWGVGLAKQTPFSSLNVKTSVEGFL